MASKAPPSLAPLSLDAYPRHTARQYGIPYEGFRRARARMRLAGETLDSLRLARELPKLHSRLSTEDVAALITAHRLDRFDAARLQPSSPSG